MDKIKNIVWILTDSQHSEATGYMGNKAVRTPNLDRLAARSRIFTSAYCQSPICVPSRESLITGRYPSGLGILHNKHDHASTAETLGHKFQKAGYRTCFSGKSHFIADNLLFSEHDMNRGFERYADWDDYLYYLRKKNFFSEIDKSKVRENCYQGDPRAMKEIEAAAIRCYSVYAQQHNGHLADEYSVEHCAFERASDWLDENHVDPFFLFYSLYRPHAPLAVPKDVERPSIDDLPPLEWSEQDLASTPSLRQRIAFMNNHAENAYNAGLDLAGAYAENPELSEEPGRTKEVNSYDGFRIDYFRSVSYVDRYVGKMIEKLEALGHAEDTMVVFTSDHGDMLGEHGLNLKMCFYDAAIKVPLLVHIPGEWNQGERDDRPVMLLDLVPTIAKGFGIETEEALPGIDLTSDAYGYDRPVYSEIVSSFGADVAQYGFENHVRMVKTNAWKYLSKAFGNHELYSVVDDPDENSNLGDDPAYQDVCAQMQELIDEHPGKYRVENVTVVE